MPSDSPKNGSSGIPVPVLEQDGRVLVNFLIRSLCNQPFLCTWKRTHHLLPFRTSNPLNISLYSYSLHVMVYGRPQEPHLLWIWLSLHPVQSPYWVVSEGQRISKMFVRAQDHLPSRHLLFLSHFLLTLILYWPKWQYRTQASSHILTADAHTENWMWDICLLRDPGEEGWTLISGCSFPLWLTQLFFFSTFTSLC